MTLDEAINHALNKAIELSKSECCKCAEEHAQLAVWLLELKGYKALSDAKIAAMGE